MSTLKELLPNQHITIDNHASGKELRWDWKPDQRPDDIHLDKAMDKKVNGKEIHVRVSLNHDGKGTMLKKRERGKGGITDEYNKVVKEVKEVLNNNSELLKEFVETIAQRIRQIGPRKKNRAVRKALERIGDFFDLTPKVIGKMIEVEKGLCSLFQQDNLPMYIGFGYDYAFHLGTGGYDAFNKHVPTTKTWDQMCKISYPTLQDLVTQYQNESENNTKGMIEELTIARKTYNDPHASVEGKARALIVPHGTSYRIHQWRLLTRLETINEAILRLSLLIRQNKQYSSFEDLYADVEATLKDVKHIAGLTYYDVAKRLWCALGHDGLHTKDVYLYSGAMKGAHSILQSTLDRKLHNKEPKALFPLELQTLDSLYLEDFLCYMHKELAIMYNDTEQ